MQVLLALLRLDALRGYRTYIIVAMLIAGVFVEKVLGIDVPGFSVGDDWVDEILLALGLGTARASYTDKQ